MSHTHKSFKAQCLPSTLQPKAIFASPTVTPDGLLASWNLGAWECLSLADHSLTFNIIRPLLLHATLQKSSAKLALRVGHVVPKSIELAFVTLGPMSELEHHTPPTRIWTA